MKTTTLALTLLLAVNAAHAESDPDAIKAKAIANQHACFACHSIDKKLVGPAWRDVAVRYAGQPDIGKQLVAHIRGGSSGAWGAVPMPPNQISVDDATVVAKWILAGAKDK
ncbi:cytochrome C [Paraburkholderia strydomiana]|uniref:c-type cytochrome n=1 Tax=Paraburkholderia strydomiana TaxID=1245417 RepID=UPI0038B96773